MPLARPPLVPKPPRHPAYRLPLTPGRSAPLPRPPHAATWHELPSVPPSVAPPPSPQPHSPQPGSPQLRRPAEAASFPPQPPHTPLSPLCPVAPTPAARRPAALLSPRTRPEPSAEAPPRLHVPPSGFSRRHIPQGAAARAGRWAAGLPPRRSGPSRGSAPSPHRPPKAEPPGSPSGRAPLACTALKGRPNSSPPQP